MLTSSPALKGKTGKLRSFKLTGAFNKTSRTSPCPAGDRRRVREGRGWPPPSICQSPPASWAKTPLLTEELTASRAARPRRSQPHGTGRPLSNPRGSVLPTQHVHTGQPSSTCLQADPALHVKGWSQQSPGVKVPFHPFLHLFIHSFIHLSVPPFLHLKNEDSDHACPTGMACGLPPGERRSSQLCSCALPKTRANGGQINLADGAGNKVSASSLHSKKQRHYVANKGPSSQSYVFFQ